LRLVEISEDLRRGRRERIRELEWERQHDATPERPRLALPAQAWDEERVIEREIIYDRAPPPPAPPPLRREVREKVYVMR
jgi:hypothetical protein